MLRKFIDFGSASRGNITLRVNRGLFISNAIINKIKAVNPEAAELFIDDKKCLVGIKLIPHYIDSQSRKLCKEKSGVSFNITPILRALNIRIMKEKSVFEYNIGNDNVLIIDLSPIKNPDDEIYKSKKRK
jgi:hypothetical protein